MNNFSHEHVYVEATVLEKTKGRNVIVFKKKRRKNYKKWRGVYACFLVHKEPFNMCGSVV